MRDKDKGTVYVLIPFETEEVARYALAQTGYYGAVVTGRKAQRVDRIYGAQLKQEGYVT